MDEIDDFASPLGDDASSAWLNDLFETTRSPGTAEELSSEADVVGAMAMTIADPPLIADINDRRRRRISKTATRTAIAAAALLVGTSTAAATGNLPDAAQSAVARASSHLGVDIPDPYDGGDAGEHVGQSPTTDPSTTDPSMTSTASTVVDDSSALTLPAVDGGSITVATTTSTSAGPGQALPESTDSPSDQPVTQETTAGAGPDVTGPAKQGLCRAWAAHGSDSPANQHSTAMKNLQAAAAAAGQTVAEFCADAFESDSTEVATTTTEAPPTTTVQDKDKDKDKKEKK